MTRFWRFAAILSAVLTTLATTAAGASAAKTDGARVDTSYGVKGVVKVATGGPSAQRKVRMALAPNGQAYVLQGNWLLAFEPDGEPARGFGNNGRVKVTSDRGGLEPVAVGVTVDSRGRVLVDGWFSPYPSGQGRGEVFVDRYLPDGSLDATFGNGGEATTTFGIPYATGAEAWRVQVYATTLGVDPQDRPIVGGSYPTAADACGYEYASFVGRLTASGGLDTSYGGKGYVAGARGRVDALAETPDGGVATLSSGSFCGARQEPEPSTFAALTESGEPSPALDPARPTFYATSEMAVDSKGRSLVLQAGSLLSEEPLKLVRLLPSGAVDTSFGTGGGTPLIGAVTGGVIAVDARDRTLLATGGQHPYGPRVVRFTAAGKRDAKFGKRGVLEAPVAGDSRSEASAVATDAKGRIYVAGAVESKTLKTGHGIQITRFLAN